MIKLGIIGLGKQGLEHIDVQRYCKNCKIIVAYDAYADESVLNEYPEVERITDIDVFLNLDIQGIVMALPHHIYKEYIPTKVWGNNRSLAVLKEKPLGQNLSEARLFVEQAKKHNALLQTVIQRRNHPSYVFLKNIIQKNESSVDIIRLELNLGFERPSQEELSLNKTWRSEFLL